MRRTTWNERRRIEWVVLLLLIGALSVAACASPSSQSATSNPSNLSNPSNRSSALASHRLFPPQDLGLLEAPDRDQWQKPDLIMDVLGIAEGSVVADLGAGGGWFTVRLARRVGPNGLVYAEDIQKPMIEAIDRRISREGLRNVRTVLGSPTDPRLPSGSLDAILIVDTFKEISNPVPLLVNVGRALKPQGRLGVVDFTAGGGGPGPAPDDRVDPDEVIRAAATARLELSTREEVPPFLFLLVFTPRADGS